MNERRFLAGMALVAGVVLLNAPLNAAVESDVVGYTTMTMEAGKWYQVGNPFVELEGDGARQLNDAFGIGFSDGDMLYLYDNEAGIYRSPYVWVSDYNGQSGWFDMATGALAEVAINPGQPAFIHKAITGTPTFPGRVSSTTPTTFGSDGAKGYWAQIACVYPMPLKLQDIQWTGLKSGDALYTYRSERGAYSSPLLWMGEDTGMTPGWYDQATGQLSTLLIEPGQSMFLSKQSGGTGSCMPAVK